jgi:hypothetical protein
MADTAQLSDKGLGLSLTFGIITLLATLTMLLASYPGIIGGGGSQLIAGLAFTVAMIAGGLAVAAFHVFEE